MSGIIYFVLLLAFSFVFPIFAGLHISIESPKTGAIYNVWDTLHFHWTSLDTTVAGGCQIEISFDNDINHYSLDENLAHNPTDSSWGNFDWQIPETLYTYSAVRKPVKIYTVSRNVKIRILDMYNKILESQTYSSGVFTINPATVTGKTTWMRQDTPYVPIKAFASMEDALFAVSDSGIYISFNNGSTWTRQGNCPAFRITALCANGESLFAGTHGGGILSSADSGKTWVSIGKNPLSSNIKTIYAEKTALYALDDNNGIMYLSTDNGANWKFRGATPFIFNSVTSLCTLGPSLFAAAYGAGLFRSSDSGASWKPVDTNLTLKNAIALCASGTTLFVGTKGSGMIVSVNQGTTWTPYNTGLTDMTIKALMTQGTRIFAGADNGIWNRFLEDLIAIEKLADKHPDPLFFLQSRPNPFKTATTIRYGSSRFPYCELSIYSITGVRLISMNVSGGGDFTWNPTGHSSGIYLCKLSSRGITLTHKIMLVQ